MHRIAFITMFILLMTAGFALAGESPAADSETTGLWSMESLIALITLTALEIVLGIDNVIFIAILSGKLPQHQRGKAQKTGIALAVATRIVFLMCIAWMMKLSTPLWPALPWKLGEISGKSLILIVGGLFLVGKAAYELHDKLEAAEQPTTSKTMKAAATFGMVILQIVAIDVVFSIDSVITAVGMSNQIPVMVTAVMLAAVVMIIFARPISDFVEKHPTLKVLALGFLLLIGFMLFAEGFGYHVPKGYIYFAMAFALGVEMFNMKLRKKRAKVRLHHSTLPQPPEGSR